MPMTNERFNELASFARACATSSDNPVALVNKASHLKAIKAEIDELDAALMSEQEASQKALEHLHMQKHRFEGELKDAFMINDEDKAGKAASLARGKIEMAEAKIKMHEAINSSSFTTVPLRQAATQRAARLAISEREPELDQLLQDLSAVIRDIEDLTRLANSTFRGASKVNAYVTNTLNVLSFNAGNSQRFDLTPYY